MKIVGIQMKRLRRERQITLRELAHKVGVSASFLSQVEQGKTSPSLVTLKKVADHLQTTVGNLVGEQHKVLDDPVVREADRDAIRDIGSDIKMFVLSNPGPTKQMQPLLFELEREASSGTDVYTHYGQEFVLVLKGSLELNLEDKTYQLKKGDSIYFNSHTPHSFRNIHQGKTEALWVVTPPTF
ncbi:MAG: helix-turn-helix transcriptional regulator [Candidatus Omnitrophica bacterium]|nr:helix-turn-helix transcriptional regulator [Candidatus Omnitrophota bacterium]